MMKYDYSQMTRQELRSHVLQNRDDQEAIDALISRGNPDSPTYPVPESDEALAEILKQKLDKIGNVN